jgi:predicted nucleic acid-binding Zn ribbon protein
LANALEPLQASLAPRTLLAEVQRVWPEAAGAVIAREATPVSERGGVVTIACSGSVWAQELDLQSLLLMEKLNAAIAVGEVTRLRCVTGPRGMA